MQAILSYKGVLSGAPSEGVKRVLSTMLKPQAFEEWMKQNEAKLRLKIGT